AVDTLVETVAPITDMVESTKGVIKPAVDTLVETIAPVTDTVESTWKALQLTVNKPVEPAAPTKEPIQPFVQPQPEKPTKDEREAVKNESAAAERGKETPLSLQPLFTPPSLAAVEEPPPAIEPEPPLPSDVADNPSAPPTSPETPPIAHFETKVPQPHTLITNPAVIAQDEPPVLIRPELEVPETITPTANDSTALRPQRQGITSPEVATPVVELPVRSSRKIDEHKPLNEPNPGSPYTDIPAAVIQGTQSCPNYSKITGSASSAFIAGILNDHVHSSLQCRILLWVRSIELYKKWSNAPPGHPPKFSFSRVL
ncbi:MAG: hypothetical protein K0R28_5363, partial [Paenibacillus sp.]|nr:hypothetical protein [Paenibacillus sp.]